MGLSYTEELVYEYFKHEIGENGKPKYVVAAKIPFRDELETGKKVKGWHDIDILAIGEKEICIVETKSFTGVKKREEFVFELINRFKSAEKFVREQDYAKGKEIRKILVADEIANKKIKEDLEKEGIETLELREIVRKLIELLKPRVRIMKRLGKEESNVTRTLIFLIRKKFLKE